MKIKSVKYIKEHCKVYDIEVEKDHSFIVQDCVLHNCIYCGSMESKIYPSLEAIGDTPPAHYNCRCTVIPIIKGYDELDEDDTRASMNDYVDGKITFEEWLEKQSPDVQKDVLGVTRYQMFQNGEKLNHFISDNRILTIAELKAIES